MERSIEQLLIGLTAAVVLPGGMAAPAAAQAGTLVKLQNRQTGKCLTIAGGVSTANNVEAVQFTCDGHPSRYWLVKIL
jgi:hypothetical protein